MTAVIGILNKQGVALAADSAVTVMGGNQKKIYNTANKIFTLSKFHPVSIMIYSSSSFMQTPWEIIIKLYRKKLSDNKFDTVSEYKDDFIHFLKENNYFTTEEGQLHNLKQFIYWNLSNLKDDILRKLSGEKSEEELRTEFVEFFQQEMHTIIDSYSDRKRILSGFEEYPFDEFKLYIEEGIKEICNIIFEDIDIKDEFIELVIKQYHSFIADSIKDLNEEISQKIKTLNIEEVSQAFYQEMNKVKSELQINPTVETVSILSKEDLSEMAESLIYLTYLKRRISSDEESVGGPIDVAIISKGDGFIWKKRKHYFSQELNKHFMSNYFNK